MFLLSGRNEEFTEKGNLPYVLTRDWLLVVYILCISCIYIYDRYIQAENSQFLRLRYDIFCKLEKQSSFSENSYIYIFIIRM